MKEREISRHVLHKRIEKRYEEDSVQRLLKALDTMDPPPGWYESNAQLVADLGGKPYLWPRSNCTRKGKGRKAYKKMIDLWKDHRRKFVRVYGRRWGGETCNYVLKSKWESELRCRSPASQHAEVGMMIVGHNSRELLKLDIMEEIAAEN